MIIMPTDKTGYGYNTHIDYLPDGEKIVQKGTYEYIPNRFQIFEYPSNIGVIHYHPNIETKYIFEGEMELILDGKIISAKKDDFIIINPNETHNFQNADKCVFCTIIFDVDYFNDLALTSDACMFNSLVQNDKEISDIMHKLKEEYFSRPVLYSQNSDALFRLLIIHIIRNYKIDELKFSPVATNDTLSNLVTDFLSQNFNKKITIDTVAHAIGFNRYYMMRTFKKETGVTISHQLFSIRMRHAAVLIKNTQKTISEISELTGFESISHFSKSFKLFFGLQPSEYKRHNR